MILKLSLYDIETLHGVALSIQLETWLSEFTRGMILRHVGSFDGCSFKAAHWATFEAHYMA